MARGSVFRPTYTDRHGEKKQSSIWHIRYSHNGKRHRESSGSADQDVAEELLARRLAELRPGGPTPSELKKVPFSALAKLLRDAYKDNRSNVEYPLAHLEDFFGGWKVPHINAAAIDQYKAKRRKAGAARATIDRELSALRRAFNLAERRNLVVRVPNVELYDPDNAREGFVEPEQFAKLVSELPPRLRPLAEVAYATGWRKGSILSLTWDDVGFAAGSLRCEGSRTKSGNAVEFPLTPLRDVLEAQRERRKQVEREYGVEVTALFFYYGPSRNGMPAGRPIKSFRRAWKTAARKAGIPDLVFHDLRRSAVRNLVRAGVSERVAMDLVGMKTRSILDRYHIVSQTDLQEAAAKLQVYQDQAGHKSDRQSQDREETEGAETQA